MRYHSKKIIEIDPYYENGAGYFLLGAVHYKAPYIPFILSWPNNNDALKYHYLTAKDLVKKVLSKINNEK